MTAERFVDACPTVDTMTAERICEYNGSILADYIADTPGLEPGNEIDSADLLEWLGLFDGCIRRPLQRAAFRRKEYYER